MYAVFSGGVRVVAVSVSDGETIDCDVLTTYSGNSPQIVVKDKACDFGTTKVNLEEDC